MRCFQAFIIAIILIVGGFLAYIYSGAFNVAATEDNPGWVDWIISTTRRHSISARADDVKVPDNLSDPRMIALGAKHYKAMCAMCHLAPGMDSSETRKGLNPRPPQLDKIAQYIPAQTAYWGIKNGIRMTGMPAWGPTHSEHELWALVAFVKAMPQMSPERYKALSAGAEEEEEEEHAHQHGMTPPAMAMPSTRQPPERTPPVM